MLALAEFERRLQSLRDDRSRLVRSMRQAAHQLRANGQPPTLETIDEFQFYRQRYVDLQETCAATTQIDTDRLLTFDQLDEQRDRLAELEALRASIQRVQQLTHLDAERAAICDGPHQAMHELLEELEQHPNGQPVQDFAAGTEPLARLLQLVESWETLDDADWEACQQTVGDRFGRELAIAAARGHLKIQSKT